MPTLRTLTYKCLFCGLEYSNEFTTVQPLDTLTRRQQMGILASYCPECGRYNKCVKVR